MELMGLRREEAEVGVEGERREMLSRRQRRRASAIGSAGGRRWGLEKWLPK